VQTAAEHFGRLACVVATHRHVVEALRLLLHLQALHKGAQHLGRRPSVYRKDEDEGRGYGEGSLEGAEVHRRLAESLAQPLGHITGVARAR
jgi:hypothetical protein